MTVINIGDLKHRIAIAVESNTADGNGGFDTTWAALGSCWAKAASHSKVGVSATQVNFNRGELDHTERFVFSIRQKQLFTLDTRLSDKYRISHRSQYFRVLGISQNMYNLDFYDITAELWGATTQ